ncbi:MAG: hypothetical protein IK099_04285 [Clostridia bacterium]|nr:hypothetical protein [Clostridia bacterium]
MKQKSSISFGPGAASLLLIFVVLAMSVLGMLSLMNSRNDVRLSERSVSVMEAVYFLNAKAEESRARADAVLCELAQKADSTETYLSFAKEAFTGEMKLKGNVLSWNETDGFRTIHCALELLPLNAGERTRWVQHTLIVKTAESSGENESDTFYGDGVDWESAETEEAWIIDD